MSTFPYRLPKSRKGPLNMRRGGRLYDVAPGDTFDVDPRDRAAVERAGAEPVKPKASSTPTSTASADQD